MNRRPSQQTLDVLGQLRNAPSDWHYGYDIVRELGIASGTVYPILMRLHERGLLETKWEDSPEEGRPRRHMYRLTQEGSVWARSVLADEPTIQLHPTPGTT